MMVKRCDKLQQQGKKEKLRLFYYGRKTNKNLRDSDCNTPLHFAAKCGIPDFSINVEWTQCSFSGWGQFLQKLCKNCPHPEKPFSNSKTISQIKFPYRIEKLVKSQQEWPGGKTLCRSLVTCKGFFCPVVLLLLLCENEDCTTVFLK